MPMCSGDSEFSKVLNNERVTKNCQVNDEQEECPGERVPPQAAQHSCNGDARYDSRG